VPDGPLRVPVSLPVCHVCCQCARMLPVCTCAASPVYCVFWLVVQLHDVWPIMPSTLPPQSFWLQGQLLGEAPFAFRHPHSGVQVLPQLPSLQTQANASFDAAIRSGHLNARCSALFSSGGGNRLVWFCLSFKKIPWIVKLQRSSSSTKKNTSRTRINDKSWKSVLFLKGWHQRTRKVYLTNPFVC
jgi:hypothetical protein